MAECLLEVVLMFEQLMAILKQLEGNDEIFAVMARLYRKAYLELVKAGFSQEDAMRIVTSLNLKSS